MRYYASTTKLHTSHKYYKYLFAVTATHIVCNHGQLSSENNESVAVIIVLRSAVNATPTVCTGREEPDNMSTYNDIDVMHD